MKKHLSLIVAICISLASFASVKPTVWDKPLQVHGKSAFENVTIDWYTPEYYYADYWYIGQPAGYYFFLSLTGVQYATWELSIGIETINNGVRAMKIFVFTVPGGSGTNWHDHVLEMISQMSPGETIPEDAEMSINHWWIVS